MRQTPCMHHLHGRSWLGQNIFGTAALEVCGVVVFGTAGVDVFGVVVIFHRIGDLDLERDLRAIRGREIGTGAPIGQTSRDELAAEPAFGVRLID